MPLRLATFNVENLMNRFDFSGFRNQLHQDRALALYQIRDETEYRALETARAIAHTDDTRQLSALAIAATAADIICLQEVDNIDALKAFEYGYLFKMIGAGYRHKFTTSGNDTRGIDVAIMMRETTRDGQPIEHVRTQSHAQLSFEELNLFDDVLGGLGIRPADRVFRRDCLEIDVRIGGRPLTLYGVHLKSMGSPRNGLSGRDATMPVRLAEAAAVRAVIEARFGKDQAAEKNWAVLGDLNDYRERLVIGGDAEDGFSFTPVREEVPTSIDALTAGDFCENLVERRPELDRWTLYHTRGPQERHLCQLDYILASRALARDNKGAVPDVIRAGQPFRTPFPSGQEPARRYPRIGWDRPKASDHCPVAVTLDVR